MSLQDQRGHWCAGAPASAISGWQFNARWEGLEFTDSCLWFGLTLSGPQACEFVVGLKLGRA